MKFELPDTWYKRRQRDRKWSHGMYNKEDGAPHPSVLAAPQTGSWTSTLWCIFMARLLLKLRQSRHILTSSCVSVAKICLSAQSKSKGRTAHLLRGLPSRIYYRCELLSCVNCIKEIPEMHLRYFAVVVYLGIQFCSNPFSKTRLVIEKKQKWVLKVL